MIKLGICAVCCLMIVYSVDVCDAECDEYIVVFEETTCPSHVKLKPLKRRDINWDKVQGYPCNSMDKNSGKKKCFVEFDCLGTQGTCQNHIQQVNYQTHSFKDNHTVKAITSTTETLDVPKRNNKTVEVKPHHTANEENNTSTYDVNLIYYKDIQNTSKTSSEHCTLFCDYAETVCVNEGRPVNDSIRNVDVTNNIHHTELAEALQIEINRDGTSPVQPLFTGYFPESSNDSSTNYNNLFKNSKTGALVCSTLKYNNCKQNIEMSSKQINVFIKTNCIENNTITKYPNCTKNSITPENVLNLKCEDILFAKHNPQIVQALPNPPPKQELSTWNCQITELNTLSSKEQRSENGKIHFINCSSEIYINNNKNKYEDVNVTPISNNKSISIYNILTNNGINISTGKYEINVDPSSQINPENIITILITEKAKNCSDNSYFNINEGKIIDLGNNNNKEKILQNNNLELILSNCINVNSSTINETQTQPKVELSIILKNQSLNTFDLTQFNGTPNDVSVKRRILLRCDHPNLDPSSNTTSNTVLQCESIDLDLYNITGIEISTNVSMTLNAKEKKNENQKMVEENHNQTKVNAEVNKNNNFSSSTNKTVEKNESTVNNKSNENNIKVVDNKGVQKDIPEGNKNNTKGLRNKEVQQTKSESKEYSETLNINRKKDILNGAAQNSRALGSLETEKILLIALLTIASVAILIVIALKACPEKREYNPAPTRDPPDEEETAF